MESCAATVDSQHQVFPSAVLGPEQRADSMSILTPCVALAWDTSVSVLVFWQVT